MNSASLAELNQIFTHPNAPRVKIPLVHSTNKGFDHTMRHFAAAFKFGPHSNWTWWWAFGLLSAAPALALALLGWRAVRAERIERVQQLREQQTQLARLADATLEQKLAELETALSHAPTDFLFTLEPQGRLLFPPDKVWFGEADAAQLREVNWPPAAQQLIEAAQSAEAQGNRRAASQLYRRLSAAEPRLSGWAELSLARLTQPADTATLLAHPLWQRADALTPTGLPLALLVCPYIERLPVTERQPSAALLHETLAQLRGGRWWLSYDERHFYDGELRRLLDSAEGNHQMDDARLVALAELERIVRAAPPQSAAMMRSVEHGYVWRWTSANRETEGWRGVAFAPARVAALSEAALAPLLAGQAFDVALRDAQGQPLWGKPPSETAMAFTAPLRAVRGLELVFSDATPRGWRQQREWLWYGFILLLVMMFLAGLALTARVVRREVELSRMQNEFIAAVSHEFKSPITSIRLLMERLTSGRVQHAAEYHAAINRETDRLERLVNRLLAAQQIQAGRRQYNFAPVALPALIETAVAQWQPQAEAKGVRLETRVENELPELSLDEAALSDALENLIDNAIKYSPAAARVMVTARAGDDNVSIEVRDEGIGIAPDDVPRIFDRFYRARHGDQHSVKGTGLGLALVKAAVEAHGGSITVESELGQGSRFTLQLPSKEDVHNGAHSGRG
jgi:signal transduction histidine kinase